MKISADANHYIDRNILKSRKKFRLIFLVTQIEILIFEKNSNEYFLIFNRDKGFMFFTTIISTLYLLTPSLLSFNISISKALSNLTPLNPMSEVYKKQFLLLLQLSHSR